MNRNYFLLGIFLLAVTIRATAHPPVVVSSAAKELQQVVSREELFLHEVFARNECWYLQYHMDSEVNNPATGKTQSVHSSGEIRATKTIRYVRSADLEVWMDSINVFTFNKKKQAAMRTTTVKGVFREGYNTYLSMIRDSMLSKFRIVSSRLITENGASLKRFDLEPLAGQKTPYNRLSFYSDEKTQDLKKIYVEINPKYNKGIRSYTLVVEQRKSEKNRKEWNDIGKLLLTSDGHLKAPYSSYQYRDLRK